jgi:LmbE family N-acetylglucosaminyl deacetylase
MITMQHTAKGLIVALVCSGLLTGCQGALPNRPSTARPPVLMAVFAHPDDEASVAPVLAKYAASGVKVHLITATDGRLGVSAHAGIPAGDELASVRAKELQCAAEKLGLQPPLLLGLHDQLKMGEGLPQHGEQINELRARVTKAFEDIQPDAVITWGPSGWTGHPDHRLVSGIVTEVFQSRAWERPAQLYYPAVPTGKVPASNPFPLATVDLRFLSTRIAVSPQDYARAKEAWLCHKSQYTPEQIEQLQLSLVAAQQGTAHFQPSIASVGKSDSLLR